MTHSSPTPCNILSLAQLIETACAMEVMSPKPGNVAPEREFADATIDDFLRSARAIAPVLAAAGEQTLGETILQAVQATRRVVNHNTNLGIILLLSPLAKIPLDRSLGGGFRKCWMRRPWQTVGWFMRPFGWLSRRDWAKPETRI